FTLDKESNTIAILCEDVTVIFAFDTREQLIQWQAKIAINLGEDEQYLVQISAAPPRSKIMPGPARLHVLERRFCLTDGVPPKLLGHWQIAQLRKYGVINNRFCFEGGSQCGRGEGLHVLLTDQGEDISRTFQLAAQGNTPLTRRAASTYFHGTYPSSGRKRPNIGRRSRSNVRRATSRANRTDDQQETDNDNSRIGMAHLRSTVNQNEVDRQRMQRVRAHRSQQQRAREKEIDRFRKRNAPVNLERAAFSYDPEIDYSADKSN
ncbi:Protein Dok-7, partial [Homalodisca vitripennis]